jgi:hypothetical protein
MYPLDNVSRTSAFPLTTVGTAAPGKLSSVSPTVTQADPVSPRISTLARQLSECAERAAVRDKTLSRDALRDLASRVNGELRSDRYTKGDASKIFDRMPTEDPELVARDQQAVRYNLSVIYRENNVRSPFTELSRKELVLIAYDESNMFTVNERYAALRGANEYEQRLRSDFGRRSQEGFFNQHPYLFCAEPLVQYRSIPLIEQVQYPDDYESSLETRMLEAWAEKPPTDSRDFLTLFQIIAQVLRTGNRSEDFTNAALKPVEPPEPARSIKTSS